MFTIRIIISQIFQPELFLPIQSVGYIMFMQENCKATRNAAFLSFRADMEINLSFVQIYSSRLLWWIRDWVF